MATTEQTGTGTGLRRDAIGLREVLFQSITDMAPGAAIAASIPAGVAFAAGSLPLAVVFALIACLRGGRLLRSALLVPGFLAGGIVYSGSRALFGSTFIALAGLVVLLPVQRRVRVLATVLASFAAGLAIVFFALPLVSSGYIGRRMCR